jgi:hypothetical protein
MITTVEYGISWFKDKHGNYRSGYPIFGLSIITSGRSAALDSLDAPDDNRWWEFVVWGIWPDRVVYRGRTPADCMRVAEVWMAGR